MFTYIAIILAALTFKLKVSADSIPTGNCKIKIYRERDFICLKKCPGDTGDETIKLLWET